MGVIVDGIGRNPFCTPVRDWQVEIFPDVSLFLHTGVRGRVTNLSPRSKELFLWLIFELSDGLDYVKIDRGRYMLDCGISSVNTFLGAMRGLVKWGIINPTPKKDIYWINPGVFFRGDRIEKYSDSVKQELISRSLNEDDEG